MTNPPKMEKTEFELSSNVHEGGNIVYDESFSPTIKLYYDERKVKDGRSGEENKEEKYGRRGRREGEWRVRATQIHLL